MTSSVVVSTESLVVTTSVVEDVSVLELLDVSVEVCSVSDVSLVSVSVVTDASGPPVDSEVPLVGVEVESESVVVSSVSSVRSLVLLPAPKAS